MSRIKFKKFILTQWELLTLLIGNFISFDSLKYIDSSRNITNEVYEQNLKDSMSDFFDFYVRYIDANLYKMFDKPRDQKIADSVNELFRTRRDLYSYNKKALYILIRERTGVQTQYITKVIGKVVQDGLMNPGIREQPLVQLESLVVHYMIKH